MGTSKQIVDVFYSVITDNNLSRALPVLDEHIILHILGNVPFGGEYEGRSGFLNMMSNLYDLWESLRLGSLTYFIPENNPAPNTVMTAGNLEGYLHIGDELIVLPFIHHWTLANEKITELKAFHWDVNPLLKLL